MFEENFLLCQDLLSTFFSNLFSNDCLNKKTVTNDRGMVKHKYSICLFVKGDRMIEETKFSYIIHDFLRRWKNFDEKGIVCT